MENSQPDLKADIIAQIQKYCDLVTELNRQYYQDMGYTFEAPPVATAVFGSRYARIMKGGNVHTFIDLKNGDILKAATYKAPAKGARGNILAEDAGRSAIDHFGANYLR